MRKTLGGDRLGSGNKMQVDIGGFERSTHDLGYLFKTTMSPGTLVPFIDEIGLPGDTFDIRLNAEALTQPTIGPLFSSYKLQFDVFKGPMRLYNAKLHNNTLNIGRNMSQVYLPKIQMLTTDVTGAPDLDNAQVNPSSLLKYLGISGVGIADDATARKFNATSILCYWDIYKNYYANKQEEIGAVIHTPIIVPNETMGGTTVTTNGVGETLPTGSSNAIDVNSTTTISINVAGTEPTGVFVLTGSNGWVPLTSLFNMVTFAGTPWTGTYNYLDYGEDTIFQWRYQTAEDIGEVEPTVTTFPLDNIDEMRKTILSTWDTEFTINEADLTPYKWLYEQTSGIPTVLNSQEGLAIKTYQSDLFNNWVSTEWIDGPGGVTEVTAIDTSSGEFTLDTLNISKKVYKMLNKVMVSGGSWNDWVEVVWGHEHFWETESPIYMGGLSKEIVFQQVVSNSASNGETGSQPLGTLAGRGVLSKKHKGGNIFIKVDTPCVIMGIVSITPRIEYSQGNKWSILLNTFDDLHKPDLDQIGFEDLQIEQMAWWDTEHDGTAWIKKSAGKQPAWINYRTNVNKNYGNFAIKNNEMFMTLNRRYEGTPGEVTDLTTYIDPVKYNYVFAETKIDAQNFWIQIAVDITARRKMSHHELPNL